MVVVTADVFFREWMALRDIANRRIDIRVRGAATLLERKNREMEQQWLKLHVMAVSHQDALYDLVFSGQVEEALEDLIFLGLSMNKPEGWVPFIQRLYERQLELPDEIQSRMIDFLWNHDNEVVDKREAGRVKYTPLLLEKEAVTANDIFNMLRKYQEARRKYQEHIRTAGDHNFTIFSLDEAYLRAQHQLHQIARQNQDALYELLFSGRLEDSEILELIFIGVDRRISRNGRDEDWLVFLARVHERAFDLPQKARERLAGYVKQQAL
jgi:hypothetical protein